jgi:tetratricopeptide (TPR) repeat protein
MHIPPNLLDAVARGEESRTLVDELLSEHLAALCPVCAESLLAHEARLRRPGSGPREAPRDRVARLRARLGLRDVELRAHEEKAREWVREAIKLDPAVRHGKVFKAYLRFKGPLFCMLLLEAARRCIPGDPAEALSLADAVLASNRKTAVYQPDPEIQAPALGVRGNAQRALGRLLEAEEDLEEAQRLLDSPGVTDPATPAELFSYLGSLRKDQRRFEEAAHHLGLAAALYGLLRDQEKAARVLLKLGLVHYVRHEFAAAVTVTEEALGLLDGGSEEWLRGYAHFNLAHHLHAAGETDRAEAELAAHEELIVSASPQLANLLVWLRAKIAWSRGDLGAAERLYTEARQRALDRGIAWDAGLVSLELALVHLVQGRTDRVRKLAAEALGVFAEQEVERETRAALELLDAAARRDAFTRELLEQAIAAVEGAHPGRSSGGPPTA